jgi:hypothetical protein
LIQPLEAEQLLDAVCRVLDAPVKFNELPHRHPLGPTGGGGAKPSRREAFRHGGEVQSLASRTDCSPANANAPTTLVLQSFQLLTGELLHSL